jgi:hypothetical protein
MCFDGVNLYVVLRAICIEVATTVRNLALECTTGCASLQTYLNPVSTPCPLLLLLLSSSSSSSSSSSYMMRSR